MIIKKIPLVILFISLIVVPYVYSQMTQDISLEEKIEESELIVIGNLDSYVVTGFASGHLKIEKILYGELPKSHELIVTFVTTEGFEQYYDPEQKYIIFLGYPRIDEKIKRISFSLIGSIDTLGMEIASEELIIKVKELIKKIK